MNSTNVPFALKLVPLCPLIPPANVLSAMRTAVLDALLRAKDYAILLAKLAGDSTKLNLNATTNAKSLTVALVLPTLLMNVKLVITDTLFTPPLTNALPAVLTAKLALLPLLENAPLLTVIMDMVLVGIMKQFQLY